MIPVFNYGIKLPRKRKKAFLAFYAKLNTGDLPDNIYAIQCYVAQGIVCEILWEEKKQPKNRSFYHYRNKGYKALVCKKF